MTNRTLTRLALGILTAVLLTAAAGEADGNARRTTFLTFDGAVSLPGVQLEPGTYVFELADPSFGHSIVRVLDERRTTVYLTAYTSAIPRPAHAAETTTVSYFAAPAGAPTPIRAWFPAGDNFGHEFLYGTPK